MRNLATSVAATGVISSSMKRDGGRSMPQDRFSFRKEWQLAVLAQRMSRKAVSNSLDLGPIELHAHFGSRIHLDSQREEGRKQMFADC